MTNYRLYNQNPLVTIVCLTYNHQEYIRQAIEGFIAQKTNFSFEILIHDDASTDATRDIALEYQESNPQLVRVIVQKTNQYSTGRRIPALVFEEVRSPLVAYCEGDDFWIDSQKLQMQVDLLRSDSSIGGVFTDADYLYQNTSQLIRSYDATTKQNIPSGNVCERLILNNPYKTCTSLFYVDLVRDYQTIATKLRTRMDDHIMWLLIAERSNIAYIKKSTATYRILTESASHFTNLDTFLRFRRSAYRLSCYFNDRYGNPFPKRKLRQRYRHAVINFLLTQKLYRRAFSYSSCVTEVLLLVVKSTFRRLISVYAKRLASLL